MSSILYMKRLEYLEKPISSLSLFWQNLTYLKNEVSDYFSFTSSKYNTLTEQYKDTEKEVFFDNILREYNDLKTDIAKDTTVEINMKNMMIDKIDENIKRMNILYLSIQLEQDKDKYVFERNNGEVKVKEKPVRDYSTIQETIDILQNDIYGSKITDIKEERDDCLNFLQSKYNKKSERLDDDEQKVFKEFIDSFEDFHFDNSKKYVTNKSNVDWTMKVQDIMKASEIVKNNFYPQINWKQVQEQWKNNYSVSFSKQERLYADQEEDSIAKIFTILWHEDATHMLRWYNHLSHWFLIPGAGYEDIEEWIAKLNEELKNKSLEDVEVQPNFTFLATFIAENYTFDDTYKLLVIYQKLVKDPVKYKSIEEYNEKICDIALKGAMRAKYYSSWNNPGANRKDTIYYRWLRRLKNYLLSLPDDKARYDFYQKLMKLKIWLDQVIAWKFDDIKTWEKVIQNPLFDKILYQKILQGKGAFSEVIGDDGKINKEKNFIDWDFRTYGLEKYTYPQKRALIDILMLMKPMNDSN